MENVDSQGSLQRFYDCTDFSGGRQGTPLQKISSNRSVSRSGIRKIISFWRNGTMSVVRRLVYGLLLTSNGKDGILGIL